MSGHGRRTTLELHAAQAAKLSPTRRKPGSKPKPKPHVVKWPALAGTQRLWCEAWHDIGAAHVRVCWLLAEARANVEYDMGFRLDLVEALTTLAQGESYDYTGWQTLRWLASQQGWGPLELADR